MTGIENNKSSDDDTIDDMQHAAPALLTFPLPFVVALERNTSQETRYALLNLDPIPHQLRMFLRTTLTLRNKLHPCPHPRSNHLSRRCCLRRLKDKSGSNIVLRRDAYLSIIVKGEFDVQYRRERLAKLLLTVFVF